MYSLPKTSENACDMRSYYGPAFFYIDARFVHYVVGPVMNCVANDCCNCSSVVKNYANIKYDKGGDCATTVECYKLC